VADRGRHIVAVGGGGIAGDALDAYILALTGRERPRALVVPTAQGDDAWATLAMYGGLRGRAETSHLFLFDRTIEDLRAFVLAHDVVFVGGGNTASMLAVWRAHELDSVLREAWEAGIVLTGWSAGAICWFEDGVTDSFGPALARLSDGLGFLSGSFCPHFDAEPERRPTYHRLVMDGLVPGLAADDRAAAHFVGVDLHAAVAARHEAKVYRVERAGDKVLETSLPTRLLD
jgi:dipeptidase E